METTTRAISITRIFAAVLTAVFLLATFGTMTVYAGGNPDEPFNKSGTVDEVHASTETPPPIIPTETQPERNPLTPDGTGTVIDNITNENGIEFFTITSAAGNVFFLVIDRQRESENVYFLNAVTERDLMALAEESGEDWISTSTPPPIIPETVPTTPAETEPQPTPEPEADSGGGMVMFVLILILALGGGAAGYYFKIYKPKQDAAADDFDYEDEDDYSDEAAPYDDDDSPPWDIEDTDSDKGGE